VPSHVGLSYSSSTEGPLLVKRGEGCYLFDDQQRRYIDCVNNVAHVGHSHPSVVEAATAQLRLINTNTVRE
jgi:4-aminobutyrate aminotransferase-like enzyme